MKKPKNKNAKPALNMVRVKTGTIEEFFSKVKDIMRTADRGELIKQRCTSLILIHG